MDGVAAEARVLREWFRDFVQVHKGRKLDLTHIEELEPLNRLLAEGESFLQVTPVVPGRILSLQVEAFRRWRTPRSLLFPVAEAIAQSICIEDFTYVKACEGPGCTLLFADHTRRHARRWCSMAICGNRAKQAAHRERNKHPCSENLGP
jgi:predicted RNA-binding Zn ribbon-like protein